MHLAPYCAVCGTLQGLPSGQLPIGQYPLHPTHIDRHFVAYYDEDFSCKCNIHDFTSEVNMVEVKVRDFGRVLQGKQLALFFLESQLL